VDSNLLARAIKYAIERKRAEVRQAYYLQTEHVLRRVSSRFVDPQDLDQVFNETLKDISMVLHTSQARLFKIHDDGAKVSTTHEWVAEQTTSRINDLQDLETATLPWWMSKLRNNDVIAVPDVSQLPSPERETLEGLNTLSVLVIPIFAHGTLYGFLSLDETERHRKWESEEIGFLRGAVQIIGLGIESLQSARSLQRRNLELAALNAITQALSSSLELGDLLAEALSRTVHALRFDGGLVALADERTGALTIFSHTNLPPALAEYLKTHSLAGTLCDFAYRQGKPVNLEDLDEKAPVDVSNILEAGLRSYASTSIVHKGQVLGILCLFDTTPHPISESDHALLTAIGQQIGVAVENARLYIEAQQRARALEEANVRLKELDRLKDQFLANMSHELRTPLNSIIGFSEIIIDGLVGEVAPDQEECLRDILASGEHLLALINDILDLSKIEAGRIELDPKAFDVAKWLAEVEATVMPLIEKKSQVLSVEIEDNLPPLTADPFRIKQVVLNLFSNANKFTPAKGQITVSCRLIDPETMLFSVADSGIGIKPEDQEIIFEEFRQASDSAAAVEEMTGTGLGLTISKRLIEMHGGHIWVESEFQHGATFSFLLPLAGPPAARSEADENAAVPANDTTVLIVEDDCQFNNLLTFYLRREGYTCFQHYSGTDVLERTCELKPALITLDVDLPDQDGWDVLVALKSRPETKDIPVLVVSGLEDVEAAFNLGAVDCLNKPVKRDDLHAVLGQLEIPKSATQEVKVLVVDDDPEMAPALQAMLPAKWCKLLSTRDGNQGLIMAHSEHPDAILLDLKMPGMDGLEVLEKLQTDAETAGIPIIVFTTQGVTAGQRELLDENVHSVIPKNALTSQSLLAELHRLKATHQ
jgi:signal transduction histidine kinase/CheY-like chemotaxis protein